MFNTLGETEKMLELVRVFKYNIYNQLVISNLHTWRERKDVRTGKILIITLYILNTFIVRKTLQLVM